VIPKPNPEEETDKAKMSDRKENNEELEDILEGDESEEDSAELVLNQRIPEKQGGTSLTATVNGDTAPPSPRRDISPIQVPGVTHVDSFVMPVQFNLYRKTGKLGRWVQRTYVLDQKAVSKKKSAGTFLLFKIQDVVSVEPTKLGGAHKPYAIEIKLKDGTTHLMAADSKSEIDLFASQIESAKRH